MRNRGILSVDRKALLTFYDNPLPEQQGIHAAGVNAMAGEELGFALLIRYLRDNVSPESLKLHGPCTTGQRRGHRLDGWANGVVPTNKNPACSGCPKSALPDPKRKVRTKGGLWGQSIFDFKPGFKGTR
jgi:hypothetical protein